MKNTSDIEALPRYVYGIIGVVTGLALLLVAYLYIQYGKVFELERQLTLFHLPTIVALNVIDRELSEIDNNAVRARLSAASAAAESDVQRSHSIDRDQISGHLHLIKTRLGAVRDWQRGRPGNLFGSVTGQLHASVRRLERIVEEPPGADPAETERLFTGALKRAVNLVEQLRRLHLNESARLGRELSLMERASARNIGATVVLVLLIGGMVVARLVFLLRSSLANKRKVDAELHEYRDHLQDLVAERSRALQDSNRELESYSYSIAHDLRTPLRTITSFSQILQEDAADKLNSDERKSLDRVVKAGKYMAQLIDDILELARITRTELEADRFDLSRLAREVAARLEQVYPDRRVAWRVQDGLNVTGSRLLLKICLENLFSNAWKYTEKTDPACVEFGALKQHGEIVYFVKDNGIGFDMRYADKLFKPFQRLHHQEDYPGTGVGLATVERVIRRHSGRIWAESVEGEGATFLFTLPA